MMVAAAQRLGIEVVVQTPQATDPAVANAQPAHDPDSPRAILAPLTDIDATAQLAQQCSIITFENEFVDLAALGALADRGICFRPSLATLSKLLDKYDQRTYLQDLGLPVPQFAPITPETDLQALGFQFPVVIKSRRHGYDGQGTFILPNQAALDQFWQQQVTDTSAFMVETFVPFQRELAVIAVRSLQGEVLTYPVVETHQADQVCRWVMAPVDLSEATQSQIEDLAATLLTELDAVGVFGIELFLNSTGQVLVNEVAPRTHNSGHLTLDACVTSQFEQHLRAICGLSLGATYLKQPGAVMVNLLGFETAIADYRDRRHRITAMPGAHVHWYGKSHAHPGRKLGHVTVLLDRGDRDLALATVAEVEALWYSG
jgi:5-(carboxyamino)imidazole ribonucleotide synthase